LEITTKPDRYIELVGQKNWSRFVQKTQANTIKISEPHLQAISNSQRVVLWAGRYNGRGQMEYIILTPMDDAGVDDQEFNTIFLMLNWTSQMWEILFHPKTHHIKSSSQVNFITEPNKTLSKTPNAEFWNPINHVLAIIEGSNEMVNSQLPAAMTKFVKPAGLFRDWNVTCQFILEGNSSFYRGISYWIFGNQENYPDIKRACLNQLMANCEKYWDRTGGLQWEEFIFLTNEEQIQITRAHMEAISQELKLGLVVAELDHSDTEIIQLFPNVSPGEGPAKTVFLIFDIQDNHFELLFNQKLHCRKKKQVLSSLINREPDIVELKLKMVDNNKPNSDMKQLDSNGDILKKLDNWLDLAPFSDQEPYVKTIVKSYDQVSHTSNRNIPGKDHLQHRINLAFISSWLTKEVEDFHFKQKLSLFHHISRFRLDGLVALAEGWNIAFDYIVQDENNVWRAVAAWHHNDQEKWNDIKAIVKLAPPPHRLGILDLLQKIVDCLNINIVLTDLRPAGSHVYDLIPKKSAILLELGKPCDTKDTRVYDVKNAQVVKVRGRRPRVLKDFPAYFIYQLADRVDLIYHYRHRPLEKH
jgi:hypothetical protein